MANRDNKKSNKAANRSKSFMTVQEAGRKGGQTTAKTHNSDFYSTIGRMGGQKRAKNLQARKGQEGGSGQNQGDK